MLLKTSKNIFIHLDCDSFFASCEVLKNPELKNKFVCVGQEIVIACTYNCKNLGVKVGMPVWQAQKILKWKGIFLPVHHNYYTEISNKVFSYLETQVDSMEIFSIDEAFCDITGIPEYHHISLERFLFQLQKDILHFFGIPVSIWCADTRIKAKIFSKINKPFGIYIWLDTQKEKELFQTLDIKHIPFIGKKYQERLKYQAPKIYDFLQLWFWKLKQMIGKNATDLRLELRGVNAFGNKRHQSIQSISRSRSFNKHITSNKDFLYEQLCIHFEYIFDELIEKWLQAKSIGIFFRDKWFHSFHFLHHFEMPISRRNILFWEMKALFEKHYETDILYRSAWVYFGNISQVFARQLSFDDIKHWNIKKEQLYTIMANINKKYHSQKVIFGTHSLGYKKESKIKIVA